MQTSGILKSKRKFPLAIRIIALVLSFSLLFEQSGFAQVVGQADISKLFNVFSNVLSAEKFRPPHLRYVSFPREGNLINIIVDKGDSSSTNLQLTTNNLLKYFLTGISLPDESFWVNLRPDAPDNIIDPYLEKTDVGKVLLEADLQLKKDIAQMTSPETVDGKNYWDSLYKRAGELFGGQNITIPTVVRPWIIPGEIIISSTTTDVYIYKANLKVLLEEDYIKGSAQYSFNDPRSKELNEYSAKLIRETILPKLIKEVNNAKRYANLRQVYYSLILAQWFKRYFRGNNAYQSRINRKDLTGLNPEQPWLVDTYYRAYKKSFEDSEYNIKQQQYSLMSGSTIRQYRSGGLQFAACLSGNPEARILFGSRPNNPPLGPYAVQAKVNPDTLISEGSTTVGLSQSTDSGSAASQTNASELLLEQSRLAYFELETRAEKHLSELSEGSADADKTAISGQDWFIYGVEKDYHNWLKEYLRLHAGVIPSLKERERAKRDIIRSNLYSELQKFLTDGIDAEADPRQFVGNYINNFKKQESELAELARDLLGESEFSKLFEYLYLENEKTALADKDNIGKRAKQRSSIIEEALASIAETRQYYEYVNLCLEQEQATPENKAFFEDIRLATYLAGRKINQRVKELRGRLDILFPPVVNSAGLVASDLVSVTVPSYSSRSGGARIVALALLAVVGIAATASVASAADGWSTPFHPLSSGLAADSVISQVGAAGIAQQQAAIIPAQPGPEYFAALERFSSSWQTYRSFHNQASSDARFTPQERDRLDSLAKELKAAQANLPYPHTNITDDDLWKGLEKAIENTSYHNPEPYVAAVSAVAAGHRESFSFPNMDNSSSQEISQALTQLSQGGLPIEHSVKKLGSLTYKVTVKNKITLTKKIAGVSTVRDHAAVDMGIPRSVEIRADLNPSLHPAWDTETDTTVGVSMSKDLESPQDDMEIHAGSGLEDVQDPDGPVNVQEQRITTSHGSAVKISAKRVQKIGVHSVQAGDTLRSIAQQYFGNSDLWGQVYEYNMHIVGSNPNNIHPGQQLQIIRPITGSVAEKMVVTQPQHKIAELFPEEDVARTASSKLDTKVPQKQETKLRISPAPAVLASQVDDSKVVAQPVQPQASTVLRKSYPGGGADDLSGARKAEEPRAASFVPAPSGEDKSLVSSRTVNTDVPQVALGAKSLDKYNQIIAMSGNPRNARELLRILRIHDDSHWQGLSPGALLKYTVPVGDPSRDPTLNAELTIGKIFEFLNSGRLHILSLYDETEPSNQESACLSLGKLAQKISNRTIFGISKRDVIEGLGEAMVKNPNARVRAAAAWALRQYDSTRNLVVGAEDTDPRMEYYSQAINDKDWIVRYHVIDGLTSIGGKRATQLIISLLEKEDEPLVQYKAVEAALHLQSRGAILPLIQATERLRFNTSQDETLYAWDSATWKHIIDGLDDFAGLPGMRGYVVSAYLENLFNLQYRRMSDKEKFELLNNNFLPMFAELAGRMRLSKQELQSALNQVDPGNKLDQKVKRVLFNAIGKAPDNVRPLLSLNEVDAGYTANFAKLKNANSRLAAEIDALFRQRDIVALECRMLFSRDLVNPLDAQAQEALAADALSKLGVNVSCRVFLAGTKSSNPLVRSVSARFLRDYVLRGGFVYTGKDGDLVQALINASNENNWIAAGYLIDTLRLIGDNDALEVIRELLSKHKNTLFQSIAAEALEGFGAQAQALTGSISELLSSDDISVRIRAVGMAQGALRFAEDPLLIDAVINSFVSYPENQQGYGAFRAKVKEALKAQLEGAKKVLEIKIKNSVDTKTALKIAAMLAELNGQEQEGSDQAVSASPVSTNQAEIAVYLSMANNYHSSVTNTLSALSNLVSVASGNGNELAIATAISNISAESDGAKCRGWIGAVSRVYSSGTEPRSINREDSQAYRIAKVLKLTAEGKAANAEFVTREAAIRALGKLRSAEAAPALAELLSVLQETSLLLTAVDTSCELLSNANDDNLLEALIDCYIKKFNFTAEAFATHSDINKLNLRLLATFKHNKDKAVSLLTGRLSEANATIGRGFDEMTVNRIRMLLLIIQKETQPGQVKSVLDTLPESVQKVTRIGDVSQDAAVTGDSEEARSQLLKYFGFISENSHPQTRIRYLFKLGRLVETVTPYYEIVQSVRMALNDPREDVRVAAAFFFAHLDPKFMQHDPGQEPDVDSLAVRLNDSSTSFSERLFRIIALGRHSCPQAAKALVDGFYALEVNYPYRERGISEKEQERDTLNQAFVWALNQNPDSAAEEIKNMIISRVRSGVFTYEDSELLGLLNKVNSGFFNEVMRIVNLTPVKEIRDQENFVFQYTISGTLNTEVNKDILSLAVSEHNKSLYESRDAGLKKASISNLDEAMRLIFSSDPDVQVAAAFYLGSTKDPQAIGALLKAFELEAEANEIVAAAILRAIGQFESPAGIQDVRFAAFELASNKAAEKDAIRRELAFVLGTSGDKRVVPFIQRLFMMDDPLTKVLDTTSASKVAIKLKSLDLIKALLAQAKDGYHYAWERRLFGDRFTPEAKAAFDRLMEIGNDKDLRPLLITGIVGDSSRGLGKSMKVFNALHPVDEELLAKFSADAKVSLEKKLDSIQRRQWLGILMWIPPLLLVYLGYRLFNALYRRPVLLKKTGSLKDYSPRSHNTFGTGRASGASDGLDSSRVAVGVMTAGAVPAQPSSDIAAIEDKVDPRITDREAVTILDALIQVQPGTAEFDSVRQALRHVHPDDFEKIERMVNSGAYAYENGLAEKFYSIAKERPSKESVGLARTNVKIHDWEVILNKERLSLEDAEAIYALCVDIVEFIPLFDLERKGRNGVSIKERRKVMKKVYALAKTTMERLNSEYSDEQAASYNNVFNNIAYASHYFVNYLSALDYLTDLGTAKSYYKTPQDNGKDNESDDLGSLNNGNSVRHRWWHKNWGIKGIADNAKSNLVVLVEELWFSGRKINARAYPVVEDKNIFNQMVGNYFVTVEPDDGGITPEWIERKGASRMLSIIIGIGTMITTFIFRSQAQMSQPTLLDLVMPVIFGTSAAFLGVMTNTYLHFHYIRKGWKREQRRFVELHELISSLEAAWTHKIGGSSGTGTGQSKKTERKKGILGNSGGFLDLSLSTATPGNNSGQEASAHLETDPDVKKYLSGKKTETEMRKRLQPAQVSAPGGIDFRGISGVTQVQRIPISNYLPSSRINLNDKSINDKDLQEINRLLKAGIIPSCERLKEYFEEGNKDGDLENRINKLRLCLQEILRIEEDRVSSAEKPYVQMLELMEKSISPQGFLSTLNSIETMPKEPKLVNSLAQ